MSAPGLNLPVIQNWSCHNCGGCCREHLIEITESEKKRIEKQGWTAADGIPMDRPVIASIGPRRYRLAHKDDSSCVFLNEQGLCRIHARFGESAKPLACQVYPYAFHPQASGLTVSLRFSCPSVVQNRGTPIGDQKRDLRRLSDQVVARRNKLVDPPVIHGSQQLSWDDVGRILQALDDSIADSSVNLTVRLLRTLAWLDLVEQSRFETVRGSRLQDYLDLVTEVSRRAQPDNDLPLLKPSRLGRVLFRQLTAQMARHDTDRLARSGWLSRLGLLATAVKFCCGLGRVTGLPTPASVQTAFGSLPSGRSVRFSQLESEFSGRRADIDELFERYFRVKIQGVHFCGAANYDMSLVDGFRSLALMYPITMWLGRWRAVCHGRSTMELVDIQAALATADHNFAYSPALGSPSAKRRLRQLAGMNQVAALCGWYSR